VDFPIIEFLKLKKPLVFKTCVDFSNNHVNKKPSQPLSMHVCGSFLQVDAYYSYPFGSGGFGLAMLSSFIYI
jgi:hypothetical protein